MKVVLQYLDGCPNWRLAEHELLQAIQTLPFQVEIEYEKIESHDRARDAGFRGSPTIKVNGRDPFADPEAPTGLSCRVYRTGGSPTGSPGVEALRAALLDAAR